MTVINGSGNVFEDMGLSEPKEREAKAEIALYIENLIRQNRWTQADAAKHMGISQPEVSNIVRGRLRTFTIDRLIRCLNAVDQDVQITIRPSLHAGGLVTVGSENQR